MTAIDHRPEHRYPSLRAERRPRPRTDEPRVDVYQPRQRIRVDTTFWQHRSIFAASQEQLDRLRWEADQRAVARARADAEYRRAWWAAAERAVLDVHRPAFKRLQPVVLVGLVPTLWAITTCRCGDRWPCNEAKLLVRRRVGWNVDPDEPTKELTASLPKPATRWSRLWRRLTRRRGTP